MSLAELCAAATLHARYQAHAGVLNLDFSALEAAISTAAATFLRTLTAPSSNLQDVSALLGSGSTWDRSTIEAFATLDEDDQLEVLIYLTVPVHEYTHHLDVNCTPFGAYLQAHVGYELLAFQAFVELFLREPDTVPTGNIASLGQVFNEGERRLDEPVRGSWLRLEGYLEQARVWRDLDDLPVKSIEPTGRSADLLYTRFEAVIVDGWSPSYTVAGHRDWFISPTTILELRGVCASLIWAVNVLREWPGCLDLVGRLVDEVYPPTVAYDYRFVLDLAAAAARTPSFEELLREHETSTVSFCLEIFFRAGWVALHTLGAAVDNQARRLELPELFVAVLQQAELVESKGEAFLADLLDIDQRFESEGAWGVERILEATSSYLDQTDAFNVIRSPEIRAHMLGIASSSSRRLRDRVGDGYRWAPGIARHGEVIPALIAYAPELLESAVVPDQLASWLDFRRRGFFRPMTKASLFKRIEDTFDLVFFQHDCLCRHPLDLAIPPEFPAYRVECPECGRSFVFPGSFLIDLQAEARTGAESASWDFQELLPVCECGERFSVVVFTDYIVDVSVSCPRGHDNKLSADLIRYSIAQGGGVDWPPRQG